MVSPAILLHVRQIEIADSMKCNVSYSKILRGKIGIVNEIKNNFSNVLTFFYEFYIVNTITGA